MPKQKKKTSTPAVTEPSNLKKQKISMLKDLESKKAYKVKEILIPKDGSEPNHTQAIIIKYTGQEHLINLPKNFVNKVLTLDKLKTLENGSEKQVFFIYWRVLPNKIEDLTLRMFGTGSEIFNFHQNWIDVPEKFVNGGRVPIDVNIAIGEKSTNDMNLFSHENNITDGLTNMIKIAKSFGYSIELIQKMITEVMEKHKNEDLQAD